MIHGSRTSKLTDAHMPIETRQLVASATGTASCGLMAVPTARSVTYPAVTRPTRSGKYFFTSGGSTTLPIPYPAMMTAVNPRKGQTWSVVTRSSCPTRASTTAATSTFSRLKRRISTGVSRPKTAKMRGGSMASRPMVLASNPTRERVPAWLAAASPAP